MKNGNLRWLFTVSQASLMELVRGPGPQLNTPTLLTWKRRRRRRIEHPLKLSLGLYRVSHMDKEDFKEPLWYITFFGIRHFCPSFLCWKHAIAYNWKKKFFWNFWWFSSFFKFSIKSKFEKWTKSWGAFQKVELAIVAL